MFKGQTSHNNREDEVLISLCFEHLKEADHEKVR